MFQFKQFAVDQAGCAMKINTDGVLLGALAQASNPQAILDIGTGTGVIALMLAQRFANANIHAVEIDGAAASTAERNFKASRFAERLTNYHADFQDHFRLNPNYKYDLIVSNPPFYIHSLKSLGVQRTVAKHTDEQFFDVLLKTSAGQLLPGGLLWLILPVSTSAIVKAIAQNYGLSVHTQINVRSYPQSEAHRHILAFSLQQCVVTSSGFVIYDAPQVYAPQYQATLKDFFTIF